MLAGFWNSYIKWHLLEFRRNVCTFSMVLFDWAHRWHSFDIYFYWYSCSNRDKIYVNIVLIGSLLPYIYIDKYWYGHTHTHSIHLWTKHSVLKWTHAHKQHTKHHKTIYRGLCSSAETIVKSVQVVKPFELLCSDSTNRMNTRRRIVNRIITRATAK